MSLSIQKAGLWKRISAWLFDFILATCIAMGFAFALSAIVGFDAQTEKLETYYTQFEEKYGVDFDISQEDYDKLTDAEKENYLTASNAFHANETVKALSDSLFKKTLLILTLAIFLCDLIWFFIIPLFFQNGQTLGKKIFGIAVMRTNCVKATNPVLFIRAIVGQFAIETMFPVLMLVMIFFNAMGVVGIITIGLLLLLQLIVVCTTQTNSTIHDLLTDTVVIDYASQSIFETEEELIAYKTRLHAQALAQTENFDKSETRMKE